MDQHTEGTMDTREIIKGKLRECFDGKIVRKDLTKKIKEGANVPVYVLEFLLGQYCSSEDEEIIQQGIASGEIRFSNPAALAEIVLIVLTVKLDNTLVPSTPQSIEDTIHGLIELLEKGTDTHPGVLNYLTVR